ncbi:hypothetical protein GOBAR_DD13513 [Gossypium barbadense]|nr:hypothetical protein GOBAR_DD13513 [Gossypium barbadense]
MSLGSTVGEDNDSGFRLSVGHENAADFATLVGEDNVAAVTHGEEESEAVLDRNETKRILASYNLVAKCLQLKTFKEKLNCLVSFKNKLVTVAMIAQHFKATIKDHLKMKLREIQRICASEMHNYAQELRSRMPSSTIKVVVQRGLEIAISDILTRIEHRNCERHVFANWSRKKLGKSFKFNFWKIMKSTIEREWGNYVQH